MKIELINNIELWINQTLSDHTHEMKTCECFYNKFHSYYTKEFLSKCNFVVLDEVPKIDIHESHNNELSDFINMDVEGITYKNVYFIKSGHEHNLALHFHELVHVLQWQYIGTKEFISRYINELKLYNYDNAPLEKMAYYLQNKYETNEHINVSRYVKNAI